MSDPKSQFMLGGYKEGNFLLDSLAVAFEDTRKGLSPTAATRLAAMAGYVAANPEKTNAEQFNTYVGKLMAASGSEAEAKPVVAQRSKPGTGNGMM
jgi:hypothetical protein